MPPPAKLIVSAAAANPGHALLPPSAWLRLGTALGLSPRELEIVQGVFEDAKENTLAAAMGISPHTVNTHFQRLYRKLHVCSRPQLIVRIIAAYFALAGLDLNGEDRGAGPPLSFAHPTDEYATCRNTRTAAYFSRAM